MKLPRKRTILAWHRWLGILSALFLLVVSFTGLALNHTEFLKLDEVHIRNDFILSRYGMSGADAILAYRIQQTDTIAHLDGQLFYNNTPLSAGGRPLAIIENDPMTVVVCRDRLIYLTTEGQLIESLNASQLPYKSIDVVGLSTENTPVFVAQNGNWTPDQNWLDFVPYEGSYTVIPLSPIELSEGDAVSILNEFQGAGISLYRVLLDLHSGRLFGWGGRTLMDLSAVAIILLVSTGIFGWLRKSRRNHPVRHV